MKIYIWGSWGRVRYLEEELELKVCRGYWGRELGEIRVSS